MKTALHHVSRFFRRALLCGVAAGAVLAVLPLFAQARRAFAAEVPKTLVLYFSHSGNTAHIARFIHNMVGGDLAQITTLSPYPADYDTVVDAAKKEQRENARPPLGPLPDLAPYSTIFLGFPNWWGTVPMAFYTLLEREPLAGKTIIPFCTHEGSGFGRSVADLKALCPNAVFLPGLEVRGGRAASAQKQVSAWLETLGYKQDASPQPQ